MCAARGYLGPFPGSHKVTLGDNGYIIVIVDRSDNPKKYLLADKNQYLYIDTDNDNSPITITITITIMPDNYSKNYISVWKNDNLLSVIFVIRLYGDNDNKTDDLSLDR